MLTCRLLSNQDFFQSNHCTVFVGVYKCCLCIIIIIMCGVCVFVCVCMCARVCVCVRVCMHACAIYLLYIGMLVCILTSVSS